MSTRTIGAAGLAVVLALVAVGAGFVGVGSQGAGSTQLQQADPADCNYESLYDSTIESVVSIRTDGGLGSGFVYRTSDGNRSLVVTNAHVVGDAATVAVQFNREEVRQGTVVGTSDLADLAVVGVDDTPAYVEALPVARTQPQHGQPVAALGSPLGFEATITHGIVSGVNRTLPTDRGFSIPDVIQTDAPISAGNSGGPLIDCGGRVVGVNTAGIAARRAENIGFAVSATTVREVVPELNRTGEFAYPFLGVRVAPVTPAVAEANDLNGTGGLMVVSVRDDVPASGDLQGATGFDRVDGQRVPVGGDVVVSLAGVDIDSTEELSSALLTRTEVGETVTLTVLRDGERIEVTTTVAERPTPEST